MPQHPDVVIYSTRLCGYCGAAKRLLSNKSVAYTEIFVDQEPGKRAEMEQRCGQRSVPQIFINDTHVGGFTDLRALDLDGRLDTLLGLKAGNDPS